MSKPTTTQPLADSTPRPAGQPVADGEIAAPSERGRLDRKLDEALGETFPASDPLSIS